MTIASHGHTYVFTDLLTPVRRGELASFSNLLLWATAPMGVRQERQETLLSPSPQISVKQQQLLPLSSLCKVHQGNKGNSEPPQSLS